MAQIDKFTVTHHIHTNDDGTMIHTWKLVSANGILEVPFEMERIRTIVPLYRYWVEIYEKADTIGDPSYRELLGRGILFERLYDIFTTEFIRSYDDSKCTTVTSDE
jgi:hypothetical protein